MTTREKSGTWDFSESNNICENSLFIFAGKILYFFSFQFNLISKDVLAFSRKTRVSRKEKNCSFYYGITLDYKGEKSTLGIFPKSSNKCEDSFL
ncbi:hypothetical protein [Bacillus salacetis]|uniref:hypothetical protein n=1 Tax=Bacillus salacetis TaxID=2315464 RepID=UPI00144420B1|nr:hypothetical protein [Bacillus salacetis]